MIEPTETESKETMDAFADVMIQIAKEVEENPGIVLDAPHTTVIGRLDEVESSQKSNLTLYKRRSSSRAGKRNRKSI